MKTKGYIHKYYTPIADSFSKNFKIHGEIAGWYADGYLVQYIVVVPLTEVVAVRQIANFDGYDSDRDGFKNFRNLIIDLKNPKISRISIWI